MITSVIKTVLLVNFLRLFIEAADPAKCDPDYFQYFHNDETNRIDGRIQIPAPPKGVPLEISIRMSIAVALPREYNGRLKLAQSREESIVAVQEGRPLKYNVVFPIVEPLPRLSEIVFNGNQICRGQLATGQIVTSIVLTHTLYPPRVSLVNVDHRNVVPHPPRLTDPPSENLPPISNEFNPTQPSTAPIFLPTPTSSPIPSVSPTPMPQPAPHAVDSETQRQCGTTNRSSINYLIAGGTEITRGEYPWLAAIFITDNPYRFHCAGSLVTNTHVITAAHCYWDGNESLSIGTMVVSLGRDKLLNFEEAGSVNRYVGRYILHPDYSNNSQTNGDADLAIIILQNSVEYTTVIKPICLWSGPTSLQFVVNRLGIVVGWGRDEYGHKHVDRPRKINTPIISQETCLRSKDQFIKLTSNRTFCAGSKDGTGPCNGDSGSALILYEYDVDRYFIRGIVSRSFRDKSIMSCDLSQYVVYVDVAKYLDWIYQQLSVRI